MPTGAERRLLDPFYGISSFVSRVIGKQVRRLCELVTVCG